MFEKLARIFWGTALFTQKLRIYIVCDDFSRFPVVTALPSPAPSVSQFRRLSLNLKSGHPSTPSQSPSQARIYIISSLSPSMYLLYQASDCFTRKHTQYTHQTV